MKSTKSIRKNALLLLVLFGLLVVTGCQKEDVQQDRTGEATVESVDFRTSLLQLVYEIPADQLDDPATEALYQSTMENMTDQQLAEVKEILATYAQASRANEDRPVDWRNQQTETVLSAGMEEDYFGQSVARNGNTLFVGAYGSGQVYVYENETLVQTLTASNGAPNFGYKVVSHGKWLAVGAGTGCDNDGQVLLFQKQGNSWVEQDIINPGFQCFVGATGVDMAMHGNTLAVMGRTGGIVNIKVYKLTGNSWTMEAVLDDGDTFWWDLDIHDNTIVANGGSNIGFGVLFAPQIYVFEKSNAWQLTSTIPFPPGNLVARNVAIRSGLIVGNTGFGPNNSYVFTPAGGSWSVTGSVGARGILAAGASKIVVAAPTQAAAGNPNDAVYVFQQSGGTWNLTETLTPAAGGLDYVFGTSLAIQGNEVTVGAPGNFFYTVSCCPFELTPLGTPPGAVFIYN